MFMDENFLLDTKTAQTLYHEYAKDCPIIDYHNHLSVPDIASKRSFENLTQIWLEGDHYKWRAMRACGVPESLITGKETSDHEKFLAWAEVVPKLCGCPLYHWTHLELQRYFKITDTLSPETAEDIWDKTCEMLKGDGFDCVSLLESQKVKVLCTTDDPADSLEGHFAIAKEGNLSFKVLPSFRPDRFLTAEAPAAFKAAIEQLEERNGIEIKTLDDLKGSLSKSLDRFEAAGCKVSDHGFSHFNYKAGSADEIFKKAAAGQALSDDEIAVYKGDLMRFLGKEYAKRGIAMQLHLGPIRNVNPTIYNTIGADAGSDSVGLCVDPFELGAYLGDLEADGGLPNTVLYNLNPADNIVLSTMAINFAPKAQFGAAWWLNDTYRGMRNQLDELMETGALAKSVGMLTDSRSFTSFVRHEYYRRILCQRLGELVAQGQYPDDTKTLGQIVEDVCWKNAVEFFGF